MSEISLNATERRLAESSAKIRHLERHLAAERRRRDMLILKLVTGGRTTRRIGAAAGISSPAITYAARRAREAHAAMLAQKATL